MKSVRLCIIILALFLKDVLQVGKIKPEVHLTLVTKVVLKALFFSLQYMHAEGPTLFMVLHIEYLPSLLGCPGVSGGLAPWLLKRCPGVFRGTMTIPWMSKHVTKQKKRNRNKYTTKPVIRRKKT